MSSQLMMPEQRQQQDDRQRYAQRPAMMHLFQSPSHELDGPSGTIDGVQVSRGIVQLHNPT
jgi:hypothetical protein